jgi:hypothetical protein
MNQNAAKVQYAGSRQLRAALDSDFRVGRRRLTPWPRQPRCGAPVYAVVRIRAKTCATACSMSFGAGSSPGLRSTPLSRRLPSRARQYGYRSLERSDAGPERVARNVRQPSKRVRHRRSELLAERRRDPLPNRRAAPTREADRIEQRPSNCVSLTRESPRRLAKQRFITRNLRLRGAVRHESTRGVRHTHTWRVAPPWR